MHTDSFKAGNARLSFVVPKTAKGKLLKIAVEITASGQTPATPTPSPFDDGSGAAKIRDFPGSHARFAGATRLACVVLGTCSARGSVPWSRSVAAAGVVVAASMGSGSARPRPRRWRRWPTPTSGPTGRGRTSARRRSFTVAGRPASIAYLRFRVTVPAGETVTRATLQLFASSRPTSRLHRAPRARARPGARPRPTTRTRPPIRAAAGGVVRRPPRQGVRLGRRDLARHPQRPRQPRAEGRVARRRSPSGRASRAPAGRGSSSRPSRCRARSPAEPAPPHRRRPPTTSTPTPTPPTARPGGGGGGGGGGGAAAAARRARLRNRQRSAREFDHVIWIWMENKPYDGVIGSSSAPFENALAAGVRARDELPRGHASEPAELHRGDLRKHAGDHGRRAAVGAPARRREHLQPGQGRGQDLARLRGERAGQLPAHLERPVRGQARPGPLLHGHPQRLRGLGRADGDDGERKLPRRPHRRHAARLLVRHAGSLQRHPRLPRRDGRCLAPVVVREDPRLADVPSRARRSSSSPGTRTTARRRTASR